MYQLQYILMNVYNKMIAWCFVIGTSVAGGYGILLGREYRLNSWEAITDWSKVTDIIKVSLTSHSIFFCLLFGLFIGTVYVSIYVLINHVSKLSQN
ncbi:putative membrane protein [Paenibacillus qinlingensis]|uniref:Membrane protein n=2 Tax=Paenibacillus qinlingensis TaxID=1837343 RepID=A0ABU1NSG0_9BACL|nr:putative membrane protein [Paenibacillus qinlingensis]